MLSKSKRIGLLEDDVKALRYSINKLKEKNEALIYLNSLLLKQYKNTLKLKLNKLKNKDTDKYIELNNILKEIEKNEVSLYTYNVFGFRI